MHASLNMLVLESAMVVLCYENIGLLDDQLDAGLSALTRPFVELQDSS